MEIKSLELSDIKKGLTFTNQVKEYFPGYNEKEVLYALEKAILLKEALGVFDKGEIKGLLIFSYKMKELMFLAVSKEYRQKGLARKMLNKMCEKFNKNDKISVITFREDDVKGISARKFYCSYGFKSKEKLIIFDYPCEKMEYIIK